MNGAVAFKDAGLGMNPHTLVIHFSCRGQNQLAFLGLIWFNLSLLVLDLAHESLGEESG